MQPKGVSDGLTTMPNDYCYWEIEISEKLVQLLEELIKVRFRPERLAWHTVLFVKLLKSKSIDVYPFTGWHVQWGYCGSPLQVSWCRTATHSTTRHPIKSESTS